MTIVMTDGQAQIEALRADLRRAAESIARALGADPAVRAVFLSGSILGQSFDELSDVDMICLCHPVGSPGFMQRLPTLLQQYAPVAYLLPMISVDTLGITFENGVHADIGFKTDLSKVDCPVLEALYDPEGLLASFVPAPKSLPLPEVSRLFDSIAAILSDIHKAAHRGEIVYVSVLLGRLLLTCTFVYRHVIDRARGGLGARQLVEVLDESQYRAWSEVIALLSLATYRDGSIALVRLILDAVRTLPAEERVPFNEAYVQMVLERFVLSQ